MSDNKRKEGDATCPTNQSSNTNTDATPQGSNAAQQVPTPSAAEKQTCENTDRELWREREGDYYADSIHVTKSGGIGINCGGHVFVKPLREWHKLASRHSGQAVDRQGEVKAYGNDDCVQIGGLAFKVNVSAQLVADKINAALAAIHDLQQQLAVERLELTQAREFLRKYQQRYHGALHAKKLWNAVDAFLNPPTDQFP